MSFTVGTIKAGFFNQVTTTKAVTPVKPPERAPIFEKVEAYKELIAYLSPKDRANLERQMTKLPNDPSIYENLSKQIIEGDWKQIFEHCDKKLFPLQALQCLLHEQITSLQFATSQMFFNVWMHPNNANKVRCESIFKEGERLRSSCNMIDATMKIASSSNKAYVKAVQEMMSSKNQNISTLDDILAMANLKGLIEDTLTLEQIEELEVAGHKVWSPEEERKFYSILSKLPPSEHSFLLVPDPQFDGKKLELEFSLGQRINYDLNFNVFSRLRVQQKPVCMIPSAGMMQAFLQATRGDNVPRAIFRFSFSTAKGLNAALRSGGRDFSIGFADLPHIRPNKADGHIGRDECAEIEYHDFYHWMRVSDIPEKERNFLVELGDIIYGISEQNLGCKKFAKSLAEYIIDMDLDNYNPQIFKPEFSIIFSKRSKYHSSRLHKLWTVIVALEQRVSKKMKDDSSVNEQQIKLAKLLVKWLIENEWKIEKEYGITLDTMMMYRTKDPGTLIPLIQEEYSIFLKGKIADKTLNELLDLNLDTSTLSLAMRDVVNHQMNKLVKDDLSSAVHLTYERKSIKLLQIIHNILAEDLNGYFSSGELQKIKNQHSDAFNYIVKYFRNSSLFKPEMEEIFSKLK